MIIVDRHTSSNQIHQGGKIKNKIDREKFLKWLDKMEHSIFKIVKPDHIIYLDMPAEISQKLVLNKNNQKNKKYLQGKKDQSEHSINYLNNSIHSAQQLIKDNKN